jgi:hypothetical protein
MFTPATLARFADEDLELDLRTWDEITAQEEADAAALRETLTGLPARPGTRR